MHRCMDTYVQAGIRKYDHTCAHANMQTNVSTHACVHTYTCEHKHSAYGNVSYVMLLPSTPPPPHPLKKHAHITKCKLYTIEKPTVLIVIRCWIPTVGLDLKADSRKTNHVEACELPDTFAVYGEKSAGEWRWVGYGVPSQTQTSGKNSICMSHVCTCPHTHTYPWT